MNCNKATDIILMSLYAEGSENDARELALHLAACRRCATEIDRLSTAAGTIAHAEGHPVRAVIAKPAVTAPLARRAPRLIYAAAAAAVFVALAFAVRSRLPGTGTARLETRSASASSRSGSASIESDTASSRHALPPIGSVSSPSSRIASAPIGSVPAPSAHIASVSTGSVPAASPLVASKRSSPYASDASVEAEISALDSALSKLESSPTEL